MATGLLAMIGLARGGSALFWKTTDARRASRARGLRVALAPTVILLAFGAALALLAAPVQRFADAAAEQTRRAAALCGLRVARHGRADYKTDALRASTLKRWLPHPIVSCLVLTVWLGLHSSLAPIHLAGGGLLAVLVPRLLHRSLDGARSGAPALGRHPSRWRGPVGHRHRQRRGRAAGARADVAPAAGLHRGAARLGAPRCRRAARQHHRHHPRHRRRRHRRGARPDPGARARSRRPRRARVGDQATGTSGR